MSPVSYEARDRVYLTIEDRVSTQLFSFTDAVCDRLISVLTAEGESVGTVARTQTAEHGTGKLAASIQATKARAFKDVYVGAVVRMGGTRSTRHGHLFEHGFQGVEEVKAHSGKPPPVDPHRRGRRAAPRPVGKPFDVKAYRRTVNYRAHGYLRGAVDKRHSAIHQAVLDAISGAAREKGLAT